MKRGLFAFGILFALCGSANAAFLNPADMDISRLLPPPPTPDTATEQGELAELHAINEAATPDMLAAAARDADDQKPDMFNTVLGFDVAQYPATLKLLREVSAENRAVQGTAKNYFHRLRPWAVDPSIKTCVSIKFRPENDSYPSGHSTFAFALGTVLAALIPDKSQIILARAADYAHNRMVCGFHYRSDTVGGQVFGTALAVKLMSNPAFKVDFDAAAAEMAARR